MNTLRCPWALSILVAASLALFACNAATGATTSEASAVAAQPLVEACSGAYSCSFRHSSKVDMAFTLSNRDGVCTSSEGGVFRADGHWTWSSDIAGMHLTSTGTWTGDSHAFELCTEVTCYRCTNDAFPPSKTGAEGNGARCTGLTSCSDFGAGNCGNHQGCSLHGHAVYSSGMFDHYDDECQGSTPDCSSHDTEEECKRQDCTWK